VMPMYEYLLCRDYQTGDVVQGSGQLAETWSHNENFTQFTFGLRKGVQFHDGWGELTSADVKFSFELAALEDSRNPNRPDFAPYDPAEDTGYVVSIETPDDYTVILNLEKPNPNIPNFLNEVIPAMPIVSKKYVDTVGRDEASFRPIGTGPSSSTVTNWMSRWLLKQWTTTGESHPALRSSRSVWSTNKPRWRP